MTPLVIQIVILFVKILAELLLIILVPAFALKFFKRFKFRTGVFGFYFDDPAAHPHLRKQRRVKQHHTAFCGMGCGFRADLILDDLGAVDRSHHLFCMRLTSSLKAAPRNDKFGSAFHGPRLPLKFAFSGGRAVPAFRIFRSKSCQRRPTVFMLVAGTCLKRGYLRKVF